MKYAEIRNKIKTGDLIAWSEPIKWDTIKNWQRNIVRMGTMSDYNHVGIAYVVGGRIFVVESVVPYVRIFPLSRLTPFRYIRTPFFFDEEDEEFLLKYVGMPYSKWEAFKAAFTKNTNDQKVIQCAKMVNEVFGRFEHRYLEQYDTPASVVNFTMNEYPTEEIYITN